MSRHQTSTRQRVDQIRKHNVLPNEQYSFPTFDEAIDFLSTRREQHPPPYLTSITDLPGYILKIWVHPEDL